MSEQPEFQTFVRKEADGTEKVYHFAPWPEGAVDVQITVVLTDAAGGGEGELRHLSYDDPPGAHMGVTPDEYRQMLATAVGKSSSEAEFAQMLVESLGRDLVFSHGVKPHVAVPAVLDFAHKVYEEFAS